MSTLIDKIYKALDQKTILFKEELKTISSEPFYTKYQNKCRKALGQKLNNKNLGEASRSYALWSDFEDYQLKVSFVEDEMSIQKLAKKHQRTRSAIESRLRKLHLIVF